MSQYESVQPLNHSAPNVPQPNKDYEYWRNRILFSTMIGYIFFYFVRKSITMAMPGIEEELGITKPMLGFYLTAHGVLYGVARFVNGMWSDRVNPRYFMSAGLFLAALTNIGFGFSSLSWIMGTFWIINGWVQGMGFPPCAKSLCHWFAPEERGIKFATWNISHSMGAGLLFIMNSFVVALGWRYCFFVPAALAVSGSIFLLWALRDTPESMGFEPVEDYYDRKNGRPTLAERSQANACLAGNVSNAVPKTDEESFWDILVEHVFSNWAVWVLCFANFFVYIVRFSILDWAPTFLTEKGIDIKHAGWATAGYELFGALGIILSGILMDKLFKGRGAKVCLLYMLGCSIVSFFFWYADSSSLMVNASFLCGLGFFIYGPQCLIGCVAATLATKKAGASSSGLTGLFGYLATIVTGLGVGSLVNATGEWNAIFIMLFICSFAAMLLFGLILNATPPEILEKERREKEENQQSV
ncbi:MAG: MFS transporter [Planctomycetia bacterium]|nr:MFS transporter [Planctomycetia bacterium]